MLGVEERTGLDVFDMLALDVSLDEEKPCEAAAHDNPRHVYHPWHKGPGEWYMQFVCRRVGCGYTSGVMLVCDPWKELSMDDDGVECPDCGTNFPSNEAFDVVERK